MNAHFIRKTKYNNFECVFNEKVFCTFLLISARRPQNNYCIHELIFAAGEIIFPSDCNFLFAYFFNDTAVLLPSKYGCDMLTPTVLSKG